MKTPVIKIKVASAAFEDVGEAEELESILKKVVEKIERGQRSGNLLDSNGNTVGQYGFKNTRG